MLTGTLRKIQSAVLRWPRRVLLWAGILTFVALLLGMGIEFQTSRKSLGPEGDPEGERMDRLMAEFDASNALVAAVEMVGGGDEDNGELRDFVDSLAAAFRRSDLVKQVFWKVDLEWYADRGLWLAPPEALAAAVKAVSGEQAFVDVLEGTDGLPGLNRRLAERMGSGTARAAGPPARDAEEGVRRLLDLLREENRFLREPGDFVDELEELPPLLAMVRGRRELASLGYLGTHDGRTLFLFLLPASEDDSLPVLRSFVGEMRRIAEQAVATRPGFRVAFTGEPATTVEEMATVNRDTWFTAVVAVIGVTLLTLLVFRWKSHALLVLVALAAGIAWAFGAVRLEYGYLNMITSSFISTLVGVGVAYGIHPVSEYEMMGAHTSDPREAVREAYHRTGAAVAVAAVTTSAAFFSILLMRFRGFGELGLVAGVGVLLCLAAALLVLPALVTVYGHWRKVRDKRERSPAILDRVWVERCAVHVCRWPRLVIWAAVLVTAASLWAATGIGFDTNILKLLPRRAESIRYQEKMVMESDIAPLSNMAVADDLQSLRRMEIRADLEPSIVRFDSVLQFLPRDPAASASAMAELAELLDGIEVAESTRPLRAEDLARSLRRLEDALEEATEAAFVGGYASVAPALEEARAEAEAIRTFVEKAPGESRAGWDAGQKRLLAWTSRALEDLREAVREEAPTPADLPSDVRERYITKTGRYIAFLHPAGNVFDEEFLDDYVLASRRVSEDSTGFPVVFHQMSGRITAGFYRAVALGAVAVFLILCIDFRRLRDAFLAMVPLVVGVIWMLGGMRLLGVSFNFANLVAVPLIIGVGIDNGVHIIHRVRLEGERGMGVVLRHTARAIIIASLTTMIGFGSLALASHRGLKSLGLVLLLGVGACLVTAIIVLPNALVAAGLLKR